MKTRKSLFTNPLVLASLGCLMAFAVACGDDDDSSNPAPSGGTKATGGSGGSSGKNGTGGSTTAGTTANMAGMPVVSMGGAAAGDGPGVTAGAAGMGGAAPDCTDEADMGCYSCAPKTLDQFLNHCPTTGCEPFDNTKLTSIKAGKLPDLP